jgi:hypothetical protein
MEANTDSSGTDKKLITIFLDDFNTKYPFTNIDIFFPFRKENRSVSTIVFSILMVSLTAFAIVAFNLFALLQIIAVYIISVFSMSHLKSYVESRRQAQKYYTLLRLIYSEDNVDSSFL